jgi:hypothetical protein
MTASFEFVHLCWFCLSARGGLMRTKVFIIFIITLGLPLYGCSNIYLVFFSGNLTEGCAENKPFFFVVTVTQQTPKLGAAVM